MKPSPPPRRTKSFPPVEIGVGIATGAVIAGGFGGHGRLELQRQWRCGEPGWDACRRCRPNMARRGVIVAEETEKAAARSFAFLEVDNIAFGDADAPVKLYAMLGNPVQRASPKFRALSTFHDHIFNAIRSQQWEQARSLIEQCRRLSGASPALYDLHLDRIRYFEANSPGARIGTGRFRPDSEVEAPRQADF